MVVLSFYDYVSNTGDDIYVLVSLTNNLALILIGILLGFTLLIGMIFLFSKLFKKYSFLIPVTYVIAALLFLKKTGEFFMTS